MKKTSVRSCTVCGEPRGMVSDLTAIVDELSVLYHRAERSVIYEWSGDIARELRTLRERVNALRARAGLGPSPLEPVYSQEEEE